MKIVLFIQARCGSSRLPNKVLLKIQGKTVLEHTVLRAKKSKLLNDVIICTTSNSEDNELIEICKEKKIKYFRGSENNVLDRFYQASELINPDIILRCTCDCPMLDPNIIDDMINQYKNINQNYYFMNYKYQGNEGFPDGFDAEIFTKKILDEAWNNVTSKSDKEHVTPYMRRNYGKEKYSVILSKSYEGLDLNKLHLSLDTKEDYEVIKNIFNNLYPHNPDFSIYDVLEYLNKTPHILINMEKKSNQEGKGQELYREAKELIPGGTQLLSKRPEMFLPDLWPSYYQKASGIEITTLDGVKMKDFCYMAIGACILGYKDEDVNLQVHRAVDRGNMSTLNCPSEVELTKLLCEIHPWANMARYTRAAGEACSVAVRIARASSQKDKIAFCGYHGWHDWYLAANLNDDDALNGHLITGLSPNGVPKGLKNTAFPFKYNKIEELENILKNHDIGTIIMEPMRSEYPKDDFLKKIRNIASEKNIILIFDETSAAFRLNTGGIHLLLDVEPDMAIFGKAMSNGYPIGAVIGKKQFMKSAQDTFISSTYWTEDIGFTASIATIKKHKENDVGNHIKIVGTYFQQELEKVAKETNVDISISGIPAFSAFSFNYSNSNNISTLYTQLMLGRNILAKNVLYFSFAHKKEDIDYYLENIKDVFTLLHQYIENDEIEKHMKGEPAHQGFYRLT